MVFSGRYWDLVQVEKWFREFGRVYCVAVVLKDGWVYCVAVVLKIGWVYCVTVVDMCFLKSCCMFCVMVVISVLGSVWVGEVSGCSMG